MTRYQDNDHTPEEQHKLEKMLIKLADKHSHYYQHIQRIVSEIKPKSKYEALQFELDAMVEYDQTVKEG